MVRSKPQFDAGGERAPARAAWMWTCALERKPTYHIGSFLLRVAFALFAILLRPCLGQRAAGFRRCIRIADLLVVAAALKIPLATFLTLAVSGSAFTALGAVFRRRWTLREALALLLSAGARSSLVLFALAPVLWLSIDLRISY